MRRGVVQAFEKTLRTTRRFGSRMRREGVEDNDASVRVAGDEGGIPPSIGSCFDERAHIIVAVRAITVRLWCHKNGIKCEKSIGGYYFLAKLDKYMQVNVDGND